jgi:hypothetical protein
MEEPTMKPSERILDIFRDKYKKRSIADLFTSISEMKYEAILDFLDEQYEQQERERTEPYTEGNK